jgi:hypothetical protein
MSRVTLLLPAIIVLLVVAGPFLGDLLALAGGVVLLLVVIGAATGAALYLAIVRALAR